MVTNDNIKILTTNEIILKEGVITYCEIEHTMVLKQSQSY